MKLQFIPLRGPLALFIFSGASYSGAKTNGGKDIRGASVWLVEQQPCKINQDSITFRGNPVVAKSTILRKPSKNSSMSAELNALLGIFASI